MITKEEAKEKIKKLVEEFSEIPKSHLDSMPEEDIKRIFITPLLEYLGWGKFEILSEARVLKGRADYILKSGNQEVLVVEAKKTNVSLKEEEGRQAVSYAYHRKIKFAVLTNFKYICVYHALSNIKSISKNLLKINNDYFRFGFEEFLDKFDILWLLSKESFEKGEINKLLSAKDEKINKPIDKSILEDLLKIRDWLSKELKSKKNYLEKEQIDEIVQILIDRLIFIRSVEDRGLEPMNYLRSLESDVKQQRTKLQLFSYLLEKFKELNNKYDSRLFESGLLEKEGAFSNEVLRKVILTLYFGCEGNQERYLFDQIPGDLFGSIYEQYLGTILAGTEKRVKLDSSSGKRKKMGIYYTPSYIVDYIVKNTVHEYIKDKPIDEILEVNILDPACGSGSFLVKAFGEICDVIEDKLNKGEEGSKILFKKTKEKIKKLSLGQKIEILRNCIYGVDLDEKAVELARLNLLLKILDEEGQETRKMLLPHLENNIKCGNSLIDDPKVSDRAFKWQIEFKDVFTNGGFDVVVGNPPYFNLQTIDNKEQINFFEKNYKSYRGKADILYLFIEKINFLLKKNGYLGVIVANYFLKSHYADNLREFILENYEIEKIIDFGSIKIFGDANVDTCITIFKKNKNKNKNFLYGLLSNEKKVNDFLNQSLIHQSLDKINYKFLIGNQERKNNSPWLFEEKAISNSLKLSEICNIGKGVATGKDEIFVIDKNSVHKLKLEPELIDSIVNDSSIDRYRYTLSDKVLIKTKRGIDISKYPKIKAYLEIHKSELQKRYAVQKEGLKWYEIVRYNGDLFSENIQEQIYVYYRSTHNKFAYSDKRFVTLTTTFVLTLIKKDISLKYLTGILNSKFIENYSRKNAKKMGNCFEYSSNFIGSIPIRLPSPAQEKHIISLVNQMLELQKKYHKEKTIGHEKERLKSQIDAVDYEIDEEVYKLYGITDEEKKVIEESLK
ncbi:MAG: N-6 DNA methylase [Candidatus Pacearchaeota archaeon]